VNLETLNRYVLAAIGLFALVLYLAMMYAGVADFISRMPKHSAGRKRPKLRNAKK
jgi:hypothetical protein